MQLPSVLGVFAHPDDESLVAGGVLARHAAAGARTGVVTATWAPGTHRAVELSEALRILGAGVPRLLGYADARVPESAAGCPRFLDASLDGAVGRLVRHIREFRPDVLVTHDAYGSSGHPDHVHTHRVTLLAARAAGLPDLYPQAGPAWRPGAVRVAVHPRSGAGELADLVAGAGKKLWTVPDEAVTVTVDVRPWVGRKWAAIRAHASEAARDRSLPHLLAGLPVAARNRILGTEWFVRHDLTPGPVA
ncbi:PIG-L deacetylase family protein [Streptomyces sp. NPDC012888]|uniref:PIG-L deacetylase family protein n=1 Tax=Streptomyces sp. NPDC012888 TaxID=3364855 RepID=UPI0036C9082C